MTLPDVNALKIAYRARLIGDAALLGMVEAVVNGAVPGSVTWAKPVLEYGVQSDVPDRGNGYGQEGLDLLFRLLCHARGSAPGIGSFDECYAVLNRAHVVLTSSPLVVSGQTVWRLARVGGIPEARPVDESGVPRLQVGALYQVRTVV